LSPELVTVLETADTFALSLAKASLDEAGIAYVVDGDDVPRYIARFQEAPGLGATPLWACSCRIQVAPGFATEARALLEPLKNPKPLAEQDPEPL